MKTETKTQSGQRLVSKRWLLMPVHFGNRCCVIAGWLFAYSFGAAARGQVEGPRSTSMHPTLLTQLLGKVGEAWLTHAKANNLPEFAVAGSGMLSRQSSRSASMAWKISAILCVPAALV